MDSTKNKILIVDDEIDIRDSLQEVFESEGYFIKTAADGYEAMHVLETEPAPNLILLDLMMPRMNGSEFYRQAQLDKRFSKIPVIVMSADRETQKKAEALGTNGYIKKPLELDEVFKKVKEYVDEPRA